MQRRKWQHLQSMRSQVLTHRLLRWDEQPQSRWQPWLGPNRKLARLLQPPGRGPSTSCREAGAQGGKFPRRAEPAADQLGRQHLPAGLVPVLVAGLKSLLCCQLLWQDPARRLLLSQSSSPVTWAGRQQR